MASVPARWFSTSALSFRTVGTSVVLRQAAVGAATGGGVTTIASYASGAIGWTQLKPDTTNSTHPAGVPAVSAAAAGNGWRDDGTAGSLSTAYDDNADSNNGSAYQKRYTTNITGTWTWIVSTSAAPTAQAPGIAATLTVIVYAINAAGTDRELFRSAATTISALFAEANTTITATPGTVVVNPDEIIQHEFWLNVTAGPTIAGAYTIIFRDGVAGTALTQPSIAQGTAIIATVFNTQAIISTTTPTMSRGVGKNLSRTTLSVPLFGPKVLTKGFSVTTLTVPGLTKAIVKVPLAVVTVSVPVLLKAIGKLALAVVTTTTPKLTKAIGKTLAVIGLSVPTAQKAVGKNLSVITVTLPKGTVTFDFTHLPSIGGVATVVKKIFSVFD